MGQILVANTNGRYRISKRETLATVRSVLRKEESGYRWVNVIFVDDPKSRRLNRTHLAHDYPTDVLAFRLDNGDRLEGELYVNLDRASIQAREYDVTFKNEVARLVIHGLLHLIGYRDNTSQSRMRMKKKEEGYLEKILKRMTHAGKNN